MSFTVNIDILIGCMVIIGLFGCLFLVIKWDLGRKGQHW